MKIFNKVVSVLSGAVVPATSAQGQLPDPGIEIVPGWTALVITNSQTELQQRRRFVQERKQ